MNRWRLLLWVLAVPAGAGFSWVMSQCWPASPAPRSATALAAAELERVGAHITRDQEQSDKTIVRVDLNGHRVTDATLKKLTALTSLQALSLVTTQVTPAGLKELE